MRFWKVLLCCKICYCAGGNSGNFIACNDDWISALQTLSSYFTLPSSTLATWQNDVLSNPFLMRLLGSQQLNSPSFAQIDTENVVCTVEDELSEFPSKYCDSRSLHSPVSSALAVNSAVANIVEMDRLEQLAQQQSSFSNKKTRFLSTGTTIAGVVIDNQNCINTDDNETCVCCVILGADTRATADRLVADKTCRKIHKLADNAFACGAGTAADLDHVCRQARYSFLLERTWQESIGNAGPPGYKAGMSVTRVCRFLKDLLYDQGGSCQANLIVGGVDSVRDNNHCFRPRAILRAIHPHGSMDCVTYTALGSGSLAALSILESRYRRNLNIEEGIQLIQDAILAGIRNDLGSGSQVDLCIIQAFYKKGSNQRPVVTAEYRREAVPEELLPRDHSMLIAEQQQLSNKIASIPGVNGFGNIPYAITSRKLIQSYDNEVQHEQLWAHLLDF